MGVLSEERKIEILNELKRMGQVKVIDLAEKFQVSTETIRRDLDILEEKGFLKRVYGGAIKKSYQAVEPPFIQRKSVNLEAKMKIGKKAAELISDGDIIVIDVGTTTLELARAIKNKENITILTNSLPVAHVLTDALNRHQFTGEVLLLGGIVNPKQQSISGRLAEKMLEQFHIDKAFISAGGVSLHHGVSDYDLHETLVTQTMIQVSKETILLADYSKFGVNSFCKVCPLEDLDVIVCDYPLPEEWGHIPQLKEITWITAE